MNLGREEQLLKEQMEESKVPNINFSTNFISEESEMKLSQSLRS